MARRKGSKTRWPVYIKVSLYILYIVNITTSNLIIKCWCNKFSTCTFKCFQILQEACPLLQTHQSPIFTAGGQSQAGSEDGSLRVSAGGLFIVHWSGQFYSDTPLIRSVLRDTPLIRSVLQWHTTDQVSSTWHTTDQVSSTWHTTDQVPQSDTIRTFVLVYWYSQPSVFIRGNVPNFQWSPLPNAPLTSKILVIILNM